MQDSRTSPEYQQVEAEGQTPTTETLEQLRQLAEGGDPAAQNDLGWMYQNGRGVAQDYVAAHMWYNLAGAGDGEAREYRDRIAEKMTPDQIAEAQRRAREWKPTTKDK